jgi:hypothetical protein
MLKDNELERTIYLPAKRSYFRVSGKQLGFHAPGIQDASFQLQDGHQYSIEFVWKGSTTTFLGGTKGHSEIRYLEHSGSDQQKPVEVDHFSVCKREKADTSN